MNGWMDDEQVEKGQDQNRAEQTYDQSIFSLLIIIDIYHNVIFDEAAS